MPKGIYLHKKGHLISKETRKKMSIVHLGKSQGHWKLSEKQRKNQSEGRKKLFANGYSFSSEQRKKLSLVHKGKHHSLNTEFKKGQPSVFKGKKRPNIQGINNHNWKGGITSEVMKIRHSFEYKLWRTAVFERDNYQCIWGGKEHGNRLNADHIKPFADYPELRFAIDNGRTLCVSCHRTTDTFGGKRNGFKN